MTKVKPARSERARSAKVAISTLASIASVSGGVTAAGALGAPAESLGTRILDERAAVAVAASASPKDHDGPGVAPSDHGDVDKLAREIADGQGNSS